MLLSVDTSTRYASVALSNGERVVASRTWHSTINHTAELMPAVVQILEGAGLAAAELDGIAVALGPGGFSALRVGISAAKGLALVGKTPIVGVGTLDMEAHPYLKAGMTVCSLLEAGRQECATALYGPDGLRTREDRVCTAEELLAEITGPALFCGEGVTPWELQIKEALGEKAHTVKSPSSARVWALAAIGQQRLDAGDRDDLITLQPEYLRMPSIGVPKQRDRLPQPGRSGR
ncbi:MAG: tRNA (adenosine(37)-N6)-threonylcarbamoyltransferase complex dimerization subunit type 1 TsaB [SAR202 cluster bacterium]|nr:tRNA (adenosine(37)-N6)-threonylcarbamoyltransferase complex dimerization subunit type 1 TsaB [Rhodospirillaceae bacterium]MQF94059.1 tRNA (adenosine(37)-N6)-threonylcarbamoyltransferase complex dimerization subunit type 1 TsaB [SAR202 cluster bacterium]HCP24382.1 tRNA (adenosine(37)-N6)-threonylcarbamoyltransferase complex dimerization subunit type 1 TsaB [Dehalococcoidia bacterium]|tara:strand:+ start:805 stop:1506 length:702 start_codon:yes stop_codon:yes gene_type:complete